MVLKQKKIFLRGWKSASLEAFAATQAMPKNSELVYDERAGFFPIETHGEVSRFVT